MHSSLDFCDASGLEQVPSPSLTAGGKGRDQKQSHIILLALRTPAWITGSSVTALEHPSCGRRSLRATSLHCSRNIYLKKPMFTVCLLGSKTH